MMKFTPTLLDKAIAKKTGNEEYELNFNTLVEHNDYSNAVLHLVKLAQGDTGGSFTAAQVLLSAYNGNNFQLDITDLCNLDTDYFNSAMIVIMGRVNLRFDPHQCLEQGNVIFRNLADQWSRYNLKNRHKPTCGDCNGSGLYYLDDDSDQTESCARCNGTGLIEK